MTTAAITNGRRVKRTPTQEKMKKDEKKEKKRLMIKVDKGTQASTGRNVRRINYFAIYCKKI